MGAYSSIATTGLNLLAAQRAQNQAEKELKNEEKRRSKELRAKAAEEDRRQRAALLDRLASERARAGAAGVSTTGGSIDAVLRGLELESQAQGAFRRQNVNRQISSLRAKSNAQRERNLLQMSSRYTNAGLSTLGSTLGNRSGR